MRVLGVLLGLSSMPLGVASVVCGGMSVYSTTWCVNSLEATPPAAGCITSGPFVDVGNLSFSIVLAMLSAVSLGLSILIAVRLHRAPSSVTAPAEPALAATDFAELP